MTRPAKTVDLANFFGWIVIDGLDCQRYMFLADCVLSDSAHAELQNLGPFVGRQNDSHKCFSGCAAEKRFVDGTVAIKIRAQGAPWVPIDVRPSYRQRAKGRLLARLAAHGLRRG